MTQTTSRQPSGPRIRRAKYDSLSIYEITEDELDALQKGSTESLFLNFAVFTITTATAFLIALLTTTITNNRTFEVFVIITVLGFLSGIILIVLWLRERRSSKSVCQKIRARMKEEKLHSDLASQVKDPTSTLGEIPISGNP